MVVTRIERLVYTIEECAVLLSIGRSKAYEAAHSGELPTIRIGRRLLCPKAALDKLLSEAGQQHAKSE
jgi:excisionase family DNA binding protein